MAEGRKYSSLLGWHIGDEPQGAAACGAAEELCELAARLGALVVPTTLGRGILPADDPHVITMDGATATEVDQVIAEDGPRSGGKGVDSQG